MRTAILVALLSCHPAWGAERPLPVVAPEKLGLSAAALARIDAVVAEALRKNELPGCVVVVVHKGRVVFRKAYGRRGVDAAAGAMGPEIVFDLASLTKPIATATSVFLLIEEGKLRLTDRVSRHVPGEPFGGAPITIAHLLTHTSGLIADNSIKDYQDGPKKALERIYALKPATRPGEKFVYSDVGFIVLGDIVQRVSGMPLDQFAHEHIFRPLGMNDTAFRPGAKLKERCAPTQKREGRWMQGEVHDPRAHALGGVAGHAGLFSSADDLAVFTEMLLKGGVYDGKRVLSPASVTTMTAPREVGPGLLRTYGWDMKTKFSSNRGDLFPPGVSFGHTGFTGTSLWLDPPSETAVIFLSNRVHPDGKGNVTRLRGQVATIAAGAKGAGK
ncbi:MAG: serine hydrolase [Gemmataceae bacterium]